MIAPWIIGYVVLGAIYAFIVNRLAMKLAKKGKMERYLPGEIISFILEMALWPIFLSIKLFFEKKKKKS
jgi:hypothetical protein